jgi:hypothetical protein
MNIRFVFLFSFLGIAPSVLSQQNLFNIPSGDITPNKKFFYQHQLNFYAVNELESKSHFVYGVGKGWDIGVNFVDLPIKLGNGRFISYNDESIRKPLYPILMFTAQKQWQLGAHWQLNVGTQTGLNVSSTLDGKRFATKNFALVRWKGKRGYLIGGPYVANDVFVGGPPQFRPGYMLGYEYKINDRWLLMGDFISGTHKKSQTVIGGGYNISGRLQIFAGALLAFPNQTLQDGVVIEINWYGWDFLHKH